MLHDFSDIQPHEPPDAFGGFWTRRGSFQHIHTFARARMVSPYAVLGYVLREAVACVNPNYVLPPTIGGMVSANLFTASVGFSGAGKDAANAAGREAVHFYTGTGEFATRVQPNYPHPGSGEGLARIFKGYRRTGKDDEEREAADAVTNAHLVVNEVRTLEALTGRKGQTLESELLKAYFGQPLGFANNNAKTSTQVMEHSYRLCLGVGVQPENAGFFLMRTKDGFPQRFLFLPTSDADAPHPDELPKEPTPWKVELPTEAVGLFNAETAQYVEIAIPDVARDHIRMTRWRAQRGEVDPLDTHLNLARLKVAYGLAVLEGRVDVVEEADWDLAEHLMTVSVEARDSMAAAVIERRRQENRAQALAADERDEVRSDRKMERARASILRMLDAADGKPVLRGELRSNLRSDIRDEFNPAVAELVASKQIRKAQVNGHEAYARLCA